MKKILIVFLLIVLNAHGATFEFKDGTVVGGVIYRNPKGLTVRANPDINGIFIKTLNNKIYVHHYPLYSHSSGYVDNGDGTYTPIPTLSPPLPEGGHDNPSIIPTCVPARINFIYFSKKTQQNLYKHFFNLTTYYAKGPNTETSRMKFWENKEVALSVYKGIHGLTSEGVSVQRLSRNTPQKRKEWQEKVRKHLGHAALVEWKGD